MKRTPDPQSSIVESLLAKPVVVPLVLLLAMLGMYLPYIIAHPEFYLDDFYFLALLKDVGVPHPFAGEVYRYHAALRPLFMLSVAVDHALFGTESAWYYATNLLLFWASAAVLYMLLRRVFTHFLQASTRVVPLLLALAFIVHADMFFGAVWISNRTETLMLLFYMLSILATMRYFRFGNISMLWLTIALFVVTMTAKAQAAHFPLLFLFIGWILYRRREAALSFRQIVLASVPLVLISAAYAWITVTYDPGLGGIPWQWLPEKVMSAVGISLIAFNPSIAEPVYTFFVHNKAMAALAGVVLVGVALLLLRRISVRDRWVVAAFVLLYVITLYPRILHYAAPRINSIQVIFILVALGWLALRLPRVAGLLLLSAFLLSQVIGTIAVELPRWYVAANNDRYRNLLREEQGTPRTYYLLVAWQHYDPYAMHFFRHGDFGRDKNMIMSPCRFVLSYGHSAGFDYDITNSADSMTFEARDPRTTFEQDTTNTVLPGTRFIWENPAKPKRYLRVVFHLDDAPTDVHYLVERQYRYQHVTPLHSVGENP